MALPQRFRLTSIGGVMSELRRIYTMAHHGEMTWSDANSAARVLRELRFCIEGSELERRIAALEAAAEQDQLPGRSNGHHRRPGYDAHP